MTKNEELFNIFWLLFNAMGGNAVGKKNTSSLLFSQFQSEFYIYTELIQILTKKGYGLFKGIGACYLPDNNHKYNMSILGSAFPSNSCLE